MEKTFSVWIPSRDDENTWIVLIDNVNFQTATSYANEWSARNGAWANVIED